MSLKFEILKRIVKLINIKKAWEGKSAEEIIAKKKKENARNKVPALRDPDFEISRIDVMGFMVLRMIHKKHASCATLFIIGGGMVTLPSPYEVKMALRFAKETGMDVFVPYYPLCTDYPLTKAYEMIHETYRVMLNDYGASNITVLGTSSGGNLALGMIPYINDGHDDVPVPAHIIAISPGTCVETDEEWRKMLELNKKDIAIPASYMKTAEIIMRHGDMNVPDYMLWLQKGNFRNCPHVSFIYGSDETLYACAPAIVKALDKYGVDHDMIVGDGMYHCYPVYPLVREAKEGWYQMIMLAERSL